MNSAGTFASFPISEGMKSSLQLMGFTNPTPIQKASIPKLLEGRDLLGQAQTGTGKTAAFGVPMAELLDENSPKIQGLILCPTRELCVQVSGEMKKLCQHLKHLKVLAIYGGQGIELQLRGLKNNPPQLLVATPGRLFDHIRRKSLSLSTVKMLVLDEADKMLDMGFREEIEQIFELAPASSQRIFFSATMPKAIHDLACNYLKSPQLIRSESTAEESTKIKQKIIFVRPSEKGDVLFKVIEYHDPKLAVIFCNAKRTVDELVEEMERSGFLVGGLHGDLSQAQRDKVMARFRAGSIQILVATDVAARGIDIDDVEMVINFHLPQDPEDYIHRIGRTGRAGRHGLAISLVDPRDRIKVKVISRFAKAPLEESNPPTPAEVRKARFSNFFNRINKAIMNDANLLEEYKNVIKEQKISPLDLAAGMLSMAIAKRDHAPQLKEDTRLSIKEPRKNPRKREFFSTKQNDGGGFRKRRSRDNTKKTEKPSTRSFRPTKSRA